MDAAPEVEEGGGDGEGELCVYQELVPHLVNVTRDWVYAPYAAPAAAAVEASDAAPAAAAVEASDAAPAAAAVEASDAAAVEDSEFQFHLADDAASGPVEPSFTPDPHRARPRPSEPEEQPAAKARPRSRPSEASAGVWADPGPLPAHAPPSAAAAWLAGDPPPSSTSVASGPSAAAAASSSAAASVASGPSAAAFDTAAAAAYVALGWTAADAAHLAASPSLASGLAAAAASGPRAFAIPTRAPQHLGRQGKGRAAPKAYPSAYGDMRCRVCWRTECICSQMVPRYEHTYVYT